ARMARVFPRFFLRILREQWADRFLMGFLDSADLAAWPAEFQQYAAANAAALIGIVSTLDSWRLTGEITAQKYRSARTAMSDRRSLTDTLLSAPTARPDRLTPTERKVKVLAGKLIGVVALKLMAALYRKGARS